MNRKEILLAAKTEFLRMALPILEAIPAQAAERTLEMSEQARSGIDQRRLLDSYNVLQKMQSKFQSELVQSMRELLERAMQTAYSHFRPRISGSLDIDSLTIVDSAIIDEELRQKQLINRYHDKSGEEIRDLNVRIAFIFAETDVKERENPFRPFLFVRAVASSIAAIGFEGESATQILEFANQALVEKVVPLYKGINATLKDLGIPSRLPPAIRNDQAPSLTGNTEMGEYLATWGDTQHHDNHSVASPITESVVDRIRQQMRRVENLIGLVRVQGGEANLHGHSEPLSAHLHAGSAGSGLGLPLHGSAMAQSTASQGIPGLGLGQISAGGGDALGEGGWLAEKQRMTDALRRFFARETPDVQLEMSAEGPSTIMRLRREAMPRSSVYFALRNRQATSLADVVGADGEVRNLILEDRVELGSMSVDIDEIMTIDVVGMLFEFILRDQQVPAEVRAQLGRLQFLILKAALLDPELLADADHPARKLINLIGTVSIAIKTNHAASLQLTEKIQEVVQTLIESDVESNALFEQLYAEFDEFVRLDLVRASETIEQATLVIQQAIQRSAKFERIATGLKVFFDETKTEPYLRRFIEATWSRVIERAEHQQSEHAQRYHELVPQLVWSIQAKGSEGERTRLLGMLPQILFDVRRGLDFIECDESLRTELFGMLIEDHASAVKGKRSRKEVPTLDFVMERFDYWMSHPMSEASETDKPQADPPDQKIVEDTIREMRAQLRAADPMVGIETEAEATSDIDEFDGSGTGLDKVFDLHDEALDRLRIGVAMEINIDGNPQTAILNWTDPSVTSLILSIEGSETPTAMSVRLFRRLLHNGRASFKESAPLFERSINALLDAADQIDRVASDPTPRATGATMGLTQSA